MAEPLRVLLISSEAVPFAKSGGLGDVVGAIGPALRKRGIDVRLILPRYGWIEREGLHLRPDPLGVPLGGGDRWCAILEGCHEDVPVYFVEHDVLFDRPWLYGPPGGEYEDNCTRFALLSRAALQLCAYLDWWPHVFHAHDWQAALVPLYLNTVGQGTPLAGRASMLTIHNLAHQGWFDRGQQPELGLGAAPIEHLGLDAEGAINLAKGGILHSTLITTVSPTYAQEIQGAGYGEGLDSVLRSRRGDLFGVLNGIDTRVWDPTNDPHLPRGFSADNLAGKRFCKAILQQEAGLIPRPDIPLIGMVTRLVQQKGIDLVAEVLERLLDLDIQVVLLGTGEPWAEAFFSEIATRRGDRFKAWLTFDERLAHLIEAGADLFLMPSRWEPCGLNQMYSHRYGTLPIVRATGGLQDTVENFDEATGLGTGFKFFDATADALYGVSAWAVRVIRDNNVAVEAMVRRVMNQTYGWERAAAAYEYLYRLAIVRRHGG